MPSGHLGGQCRSHWPRKEPSTCCLLATQIWHELLGNQADDRKYCQPSTATGARKGVIILTNNPFPRKSTTGKKWAKFKQGLEKVLELENMEGRAMTLELRKIAGLGVYVTELYPSGRCFLKGFFNAIEGF